MSVTSAEVARLAGVSRATVSYVLNDVPSQSISSRTRETVLRAAEELGYRPNVLARSLKRGRSDNVVFPMPGMQLNHALSCLVDACAAALAPLGLSLIRDFSDYPDPTQQLAAWTGLAPAAVLDIVLHHDHPALPGLRASGIPVLSAALPRESGWESSGDVFAREQRLTQLRYLLDRGHRRITTLIPRVVPVDPRTEQKLLRALRRVARSAGAELRIERAELDEVAGVVAGLAPRPEALAAHNDEYAIAALTALQHRGLRVPDDVAVIGIDDLPLGRVVTPALTTLSADVEAFAAALGRAVDGILSGRVIDEPLPVPGQRLIVRQSA